MLPAGKVPPADAVGHVCARVCCVDATEACRRQEEKEGKRKGGGGGGAGARARAEKEKEEGRRRRRWKRRGGRQEAGNVQDACGSARAGKGQVSMAHLRVDRVNTHVSTARVRLLSPLKASSMRTEISFEPKKEKLA